MLYVASPDYSQLRIELSEGEGRIRLAEKLCPSQGSVPAQAIAEQCWNRPNPREVQAGGDLVAAQSALKVLGITDPDALVGKPASFEVPVKAPIAGEVVEQDVAAGQLIQPAPRNAS